MPPPAVGERVVLVVWAAVGRRSVAAPDAPFVQSGLQAGDRRGV